MPMIPMTTRCDYDGRVNMDLFSLMLDERIILLNGEIDENTAAIIVSELLYLEAKSNTQPITMYINSPGGSVHAGLAIYDTIRQIRPTVITVGIGICASMAAVLLASGDKRLAYENTEIMIHQPFGDGKGQVSEMEILINRLIYMKNKLHQILAKHTKQDIKKIAVDSDRDFFMSAEDALSYGIIDEILHSPKGAKP